MFDRQEELQHIKSIPMADILQALGRPVTGTGRNMFFSLREEAKPSCHILQDGPVWVYYDHGTGQRGTNIDLVKELRGLDYVGAVRWLRERYAGPQSIAAPLPAQAAPPAPASAASWRLIDEDAPDRFAADLERHRHITPADMEYAGIRAVRIQHTKKKAMKFWLLGHRNLAGGWHCFSAQPGKGKYIVAPDGLGWVKGDPRANTLIIAESILDALATQKSYGINADLVYARVPLAARLGKALLKRDRPYSVVIMAVDRDPGGDQAAEIIGNVIGARMGPVERMEMRGKDPCDELKRRDQEQGYTACN